MWVSVGPLGDASLGVLFIDSGMGRDRLHSPTGGPSLHSWASCDCNRMRPSL